MSELVYVSIISGFFALSSLIFLHFSWRHKLQMTVQAEEIKAQRDLNIKQQEVKIAKLKSPYKQKRLPRGYRNQLVDLLDLLGSDQVQDIVNALSGREEEFKGNKLLEMLMPLANGFLNAQQEKEAPKHISQGRL